MARDKDARSSLAADLRPVAKALIKEALRVYDSAKVSLNKAGERFEDLVSEARSEMKANTSTRPSKKRKKT